MKKDPGSRSENPKMSHWIIRNLFACIPRRPRLRYQFQALAHHQHREEHEGQRGASQQTHRSSHPSIRSRHELRNTNVFGRLKRSMQRKVASKLKEPFSRTDAQQPIASKPKRTKAWEWDSASSVFLETAKVGQPQRRSLPVNLQEIFETAYQCDFFYFLRNSASTMSMRCCWL